MTRRTKVNLLWRLKDVLGVVGLRVPFRSWRDYMRPTPEEEREAWEKFNEAMVGHHEKMMQQMFHKEPLMEFLKGKTGVGSKGRTLIVPLKMEERK